MKMEVLRCLTVEGVLVEGVLKELAMFALVYNLIRIVMIEAARRQEVAVDRINFVGDEKGTQLFSTSSADSLSALVRSLPRSASVAQRELQSQSSRRLFLPLGRTERTAAVHGAT
jgi:hypothetical protein